MNHLRELAARIAAGAGTLMEKHEKDLLWTIQRQLAEGFDTERLITPLEGIIKNVCITDPPDGSPRQAVAIMGGIKDQRRDPQSARIVRDDGAWIHFTITVLRRPKAVLELLAYDFEIVFPRESALRWLRFDLNLPDHRNEQRDLRAHLHPGDEELIVPAPRMLPTEILHVLVDGLRPRNPRKPRRE